MWIALARVPGYLPISTSTSTSTLTLELTNTSKYCYCKSTGTSLLGYCEYGCRVRVPQPFYWWPFDITIQGTAIPAISQSRVPFVFSMRPKISFRIWTFAHVHMFLNLFTKNIRTQSQWLHIFDGYHSIKQSVGYGHYIGTIRSNSQYPAEEILHSFWWDSFIWFSRTLPRRADNHFREK